MMTEHGSDISLIDLAISPLEESCHLLSFTTMVESPDEDFFQSTSDELDKSGCRPAVIPMATPRQINQIEYLRKSCLPGPALNRSYTCSDSLIVHVDSTEEDEDDISINIVDSSTTNLSEKSHCEDDDLNVTIDLNSDNSKSSIDVGTQSDLSFNTSAYKSLNHFGNETNKRKLEDVADDLEMKIKKARFSRENIVSRPPLRNKRRRKHVTHHASQNQINKMYGANDECLKNFDNNKTCNIQ